MDTGPSLGSAFCNGGVEAVRRQCAILSSFPRCLIPPSPVEKGLPAHFWETFMQTVADVFSHVLLSSCPKCGNPLASVWTSTEKNLEGADAQRLDRKCGCGWSGSLVGAQALRHWIEPWRNPVKGEPEGPELRRQPHPCRSFPCPNCASTATHKSRREGLLEVILHTVFFVSPFRCEDCYERYFRVRFLTPPSVHKRHPHAA